MALLDIRTIHLNAFGYMLNALKALFFIVNLSNYSLSFFQATRFLSFIFSGSLSGERALGIVAQRFSGGAHTLLGWEHPKISDFLVKLYGNRHE